MLTAVNIEYSLREIQPYLNPVTYGRIISSGTSGSAINIICRPILKAIMLRRVKGQVVTQDLGEETVIIENISLFRVIVRKIRINDEQAALYIKAYKDLISKLEGSKKFSAKNSDDD